MIQKSLLFLALPVFFSFSAYAQTKEDSVKNTIRQLFEGMKNTDSTLVSKVFAPQARLLTVVDHEGSTEVREATIATFLQAVAAPRDEVWDERILNYTVNIDEQLATVWTPYRFYRGATFSHCGVNAFQLYQADDGWKILQIVDTRRKDRCPE